MIPDEGWQALFGITGYVCGSGHNEVVARMANRFGTLHQATPFHLAASAECAFAASALGQGPDCDGRLFRAQDGSLVAIDGEIFGLAATEDYPATQAQRFYDAFQREGSALLTKLRGAFSVAVWNPRTHRLSLITDPYGLRSLYFVREGAVFAFGSRVRSVLCALPSLPDVDQDGLADFMLLGMPMGQRTLFRGVALVPAGAVLTFENGNVRTQRYEEVVYARTASSPMSASDATDRLYHAFLDAGEEQIGSDHAFNVPLSGGLDSRIVAALAARFSKRVSTQSMGDADSADLMIAPRVAEALGLPNEAWVIRPEEWIDWVDESIYRTDGMYNPMDAQIMSVARRLLSPESITLDGTSSIDGYFRFFDPLLQRFIPDYVSHTRHALKVTPDALLDTRGRWLFSPLSRSDFARSALGRVQLSLEGMLDTIPRGIRANPFDAMDYMDQLHRVRRFNMMGTVLLRGATEVRHPFFDRRVTDVIRSLRSEHRSREKLVLGQVLRRLSPAAARVRYERTGLRADAGVFQHGLRYAKLAGYRAMDALLSRAPRRLTPVVDYRRWCREEPAIQTFLRDTLGGPNTQSASLLGYDTMQVVLNDCLSSQGMGTTTFLVGRLLAYELWRRQVARQVGEGATAV